MLILAMLGGGMAIGALVQLLAGRPGTGIDWTLALSAGILGSLVGGVVGSLLAGDGLRLRPSGLIGTFLGAVLVTAIWTHVDSRSAAGG